MVNKKRQKRQEIFHELAINLAFYTEGKIRQRFACPFCLKLFDSIDQLSDAHIFPEALGGRTITLACKGCNSAIGSKIESYETERVKFNDAFSGKGQNCWKVALTPKSDNVNSQNIGKVTAEMKLVENEARTELQFHVTPKGYSPKALEEISKLWGEAGSSVNVEFQARAGWTRGKLTYLHSAFLFLFSQFGYEWALDPCTQVIREQIQKPEEDLISFDPLALAGSELTNHLPDGQAQISWYLITEPKESRGFLIVFSGLEHWSNPLGVWMPLFGCSYEPPKSINFCTLPLQTLRGHLSTFNFMYLGHQLVKRFFGKSETENTK
ncbi:hypothetical protein NIES4073_68810 [Kalymmatonema gypsitolerans NIES-4073]|nr:hypothetical protein NIES4073_68810 [Scytonema sp. NIES-4073]